MIIVCSVYTQSISKSSILAEDLALDSCTGDSGEQVSTQVIEWSPEAQIVTPLKRSSLVRAPRHRF